MIMKTTPKFLALIAIGNILAAVIASAAESESQSGWEKPDWSISPALLNSSNEDELNPAVRFNGAVRYEPVTECRLRWFAEGRTGGTLALDQNAHSENLFAEVSGGISYNTFRVPEGYRQFPGAEGVLQAETNKVVEHPTFGRFDLGPKLRYETDQPLENQNFTYGVKAGYVLGSKRGWRAFVPSFVAAYERVEVLRSDRFESLGASEDPFYRFSVAGSWNYRIGTLFDDEGWITGLGLHADVRYYLAHDLPSEVKAAGDDEAFYVAGALSYELTDLGFDYLRQAFVRVAHGRLPPSVEDDTMIFIGIVLGPKQSPQPSTPDL